MTKVKERLKALETRSETLRKEQYHLDNEKSLVRYAEKLESINLEGFDEVKSLRIFNGSTEVYAYPNNLSSDLNKMAAEAMKPHLVAALKAWQETLKNHLGLI